MHLSVSQDYRKRQEEPARQKEAEKKRQAELARQQEAEEKRQAREAARP